MTGHTEDSDDRAPGIRDAESVLADFAAGSAMMGLPTPPPEVELLLVDALDEAREQVDNSVRDLPPTRTAVVALLRGVASALAEDGLLESWRFPTECGRWWWDQGYQLTHRLTGHRFDRWTCTCCGRRVGAVNNREHAPGCRQHEDNWVDPWETLGLMGDGTSG